MHLALCCPSVVVHLKCPDLLSVVAQGHYNPFVLYRANGAIDLQDEEEREQQEMDKEGGTEEEPDEGQQSDGQGNRTIRVSSFSFSTMAKLRA